MLKFVMKFLPRSYEELIERETIISNDNANNICAELLDLDSVDILKTSVSETMPNFSDPNFKGTQIELYLKICGLKNSSEYNNESYDSPKYQEYLKRLKLILVNAKGLTLDIGCDAPENVIELLPQDCRYIGLDPNLEDYSIGVVKGMAEFLPFKDKVFDTVMFNTSLDHVFDYNLAFLEAVRVLKVGGVVIIATLVYIEKFELWRDQVHFHHFLPANIEGLLENLSVLKVNFYRYGTDKHRYGAFICAEKM
jgi:SAM-dependent methyltransferase